MEYLLRCWSHQDIPFDEVRVFSRARIEGIELNGKFRPEVVPSSGPGIWWQAIHLRPRATRADVFCGFYTLPPGHRGKSVVVNMGIYEGRYAFPGWRARAQSRHYASSARHADAVIANAPSTKADLVHYYGIPEDKIAVIWPGVDERFRPRVPGDENELDDLVERLLGERAPYLLFVGKLSARRNVAALVEAFALVVARRPDLRLLLVGPDTGSVPIADLARRHEVVGSLRHIEFLDQEALALLYRGARAFVMPTTREGFSYPILEAMASGCPVLTLRGVELGVFDYLEDVLGAERRAVVLEAAGPEPASLAEGLERLASDDDLYVSLREQGLRCAARFPTWDEHARAVMAALADVARRGR